MLTQNHQNADSTVSGFHNYDYKKIPQGWQCPVCTKVHNPMIPNCECHKKKTSQGTQLDLFDNSDMD